MKTSHQKTTNARERIRDEKVKKAQDFAKKAVDSVENVKDSVREKADAVRDSVVRVSQQADRSMISAYKKTGNIKNDIKRGANEISKDMRRTVTRVSKDFHHHDM